MEPAEHTARRRSARSLGTIAAIAPIAAACSSASDTDGPAPASVAVSIPNQGGTNEGHTPIGFSGTGTGLFVGDNLNAGSRMGTVTGGTTVSCDITKAVQAALDEGSTSVQFRLRFEQVADGDGEQDLAMFYRSDSNTNEEGLFTLALNGD